MKIHINSKKGQTEKMVSKIIVLRRGKCPTTLHNQEKLVNIKVGSNKTIGKNRRKQSIGGN